MKSINSAEPFGQKLIKVISDVCFTFFVLAVLVVTVIAITYQPPDPWLESSKAMSKVFSSVENATFKQDDSILRTGEDIVAVTPSPAVKEEQPVTLKTVELEEKNVTSQAPTADCDPNQAINCSDPKVLVLIKKFNLKVFKSINIFEYQLSVQGSKPNECDVAWRFRSKKEKSWRKYRDFRRFSLDFDLNCNYKVTGAGRWHSGKNARPVKMRKNTSNFSDPNHHIASPPFLVIDENINDTVPMPTSESSFRKGKYLYYSHGGDYCKGMNQYLWSFLCALGEAQYLNRTFVMDLSMCLSSKYTPSNKDEEGKDFRYYYDFEHLKESTSIIEEGQFLQEVKKWNKEHKKDQIPVRKVTDYKVSPMRLKRDKSTIIWREFDQPEPDNYWYRVCEGPAEKYVQRPWHLLWKSKRLMNIVSAISGSLDWDYDAVHVVRGEKAENKELWPNLDRDTSPDVILSKLTNIIHYQRKLYIATNEPDYNYFDKLRSQFKVSLLRHFQRTGNLWTAGGHIVTAVIGSGILSLAWCMAQLGWIAGIAAMLIFSAITYYTCCLLADCYRSGHPTNGKRNTTYIGAVRANLGRKQIWLCGLVQYISLYGAAIGYTITASLSMVAIGRSNCFHKNGHDALCDFSDSNFTILFGLAEIVLSQIPNFDQAWWLSIAAAIMSFTYATIGLGLAVAKVVDNREIKGSLGGVSIGAIGEAEKVWVVFQALGDIAFAYSFSVVLIEIQDTLKSPPAENITMKRASLLGVAITTVFYVLCACFGYAAFGNNAPENLLTSFGFYEPYWLIDFGNACVAFHLLGAYQVYSQPVFAFIEQWFSYTCPNSRFINDQYGVHIPFYGLYKVNFFSLVWRTAFVVSTTSIAILFPFFNDVLALLGAINFWPLTVYFPVEMYIAHAKIQRWTTRWIFLQTLSFVCLLVSLTAAVGSLEGVVESLKVRNGTG